MAASLSIITPFKNASPWLRECLISGIHQDFTDWEWIFVNDHSTDNSLAIIEEFSQHDLRIKVFPNPASGIIPALQKGLTESCGKWISRMDADDMMPKGRLRLMTKALASAEPKTIISGLVEYFAKDKISKGYRSYQSWLNAIALENSHWENIYRECIVASPNWMMSSAELAAIGGFEGLIYPEDYDLAFRWYQNGLKIKSLPEVTLYWREHPHRTSRNSRHYTQSKFFELKLKRFVKLDLKKEKPVLWGTGLKARLAARILKSYSIAFYWMDLNPGKFPKGINGHMISDYRDIERLSEPQLLVAVYPAEEDLNKLKAYLEKLEMKAGRDYWFL